MKVNKTNKEELNIYDGIYNFLKNIYPDIKYDYEIRIIEGHEIPEYNTLSNIPFDIRYIGGEDVYIDGYVLSDFEEIKRYINKKLQEIKNEDL